MTRAFHGQILGVIAVVAATVAACGGGPDQPSPSPATTPAPPATATSTATASPPPTTTPTTAPSPRATATATPSPTPVTATATATATPSPTPPATPDATTFRYDTYDTTGAVSTPGSYAFLSDPDDTSTVVTTYEALRDGTTTALLIHTSDADGASRADVYDAVEAGDLFEWHEADDCFVRYTVTEVKPDPTGTVPRKLLAVEWMTYAFTGCGGTVSGDLAASMDFGPLPDLGGTSLTVPVVHGIYQLVPAGWTGATRAYEEVQPPNNSSNSPVYTESLTEAGNLPYWRAPDLPAGWKFDRAISGGLADPGYGYTAEYVAADGSSAFRLKGYHASARYYLEEATRSGNGGSWETRAIAGRPAQVVYSPPGAAHDWHFPITVWVYDEASESEYKIIGFDLSLRGANVDAVIAIAESLFTPAPPVTSATTFRYDTYDTTGAVSTPGSYAFLADPADPSTVVTTYEALRDGTTTALLIHTSDADATPRDDIYDAVEAGDLFEWHQADDCFVRYRVEDILPAPPSTAARKFLAVEWIAYAGTGCQGSLSAEAVGVRWSPPVIALRATGSRAVTLIASPIRYGPYLLTPVDWEGSLEPHGPVGMPPDAQGLTEPSADALPEWPSWDPAEVRRHPLWRDPVLPEGWALRGAVAYDADSLSATYEDEENLVVVTISLQENRPFYQATPGGPDANIWEARTVDDRPAILWYDPLRNNGIPLNSVKIFDESTGVEVYVSNYTAYTADALETTIAIARSLFESPNAP